MSDQKILPLAICGRIGPGYQVPRVKGIETKCKICEVDIFLCDSTVESMKATPGLDLEKSPLVTLCTKCGMLFLERHKNVSLVMPTLKQLEDFIKQEIYDARSRS